MEPESDSQGDWRRLHAFGWPAGSVRALMALVVFGTMWVFLVLRPDQDVPEYLRDLLFIILGHYFAVRSRNQSGTAAAGSEPSAEEPGPPPLYLPRGSVRLLLIGGFAATAVLLHRQGRFGAVNHNPAVVTLLLVFGFVLGWFLRHLALLILGGERRPPRWLEDGRALVSLAAAVILVVIVWDQFAADSFHWGLASTDLGLGRLRLPHVAAAVVGFYFGSRS